MHSPQNHRGSLDLLTKARASSSRCLCFLSTRPFCSCLSTQSHAHEIFLIRIGHRSARVKSILIPNSLNLLAIMSLDEIRERDSKAKGIGFMRHQI